MEEWRDIKGYEGVYQVSNLGNVKSLDRVMHTKNNGIRKVKGKVLKPHVETLGYLSVALAMNGTRVFARIHRLVAEAFISNEQKKSEVNHKDGNKSNNTVSNLEYATHSENMQHAVRSGLKKRAYPVEMIDRTTGEVLRTFQSIHSASQYLGKSSMNNIWSCATGKTKHAYGYKWRLVNPLSSR